MFRNIKTRHVTISQCHNMVTWYFFLSISLRFNRLTNVSRKLRHANSTKAANTMKKHKIMNTSRAVAYPTYLKKCWQNVNGVSIKKKVYPYIYTSLYVIFFIPEVYFSLQTQLLQLSKRLWLQE